MAAPTSSNEVTVGQLSKVLVGSDGNGGMWKKVKDLAGTKSDTTHTHGNIANGGKLTDTAAAAAGNDYVVIRDADNAKIQTSTIKGTDVADAVSKKHSHSTLTLSTTAQAYDGSHTLALPSTDPYTSARTPASHTHGNIQNGGTLQTSDITIANGDKLVVTDASDSNKVARTSVSFDGSTTTKALTQKGTFESFAKSGDITTAIQALDVSSVGGAGKYISAISETDGKISATATTMDTTPTANSTNAVTSGGIATALAGKAASSHTHSVKINGSTKTIEASGGTAVELGTFKNFQYAKVYVTNNAYNASSTRYFLLADCEKTYTANWQDTAEFKMTAYPGPTPKYMVFRLCFSGTKTTCSTPTVYELYSGNLSSEERKVIEVRYTTSVVSNTSITVHTYIYIDRNYLQSQWTSFHLVPLSIGVGDRSNDIDNGLKCWNYKLSETYVTSLPGTTVAHSSETLLANISGNAATATTATNYSSSGGIATALAGKAETNHTHGNDVVGGRDYSIEIDNTSSSAPGWSSVVEVNKNSSNYRSVLVRGKLIIGNGNWSQAYATEMEFQAILMATSPESSCLVATPIYVRTNGQGSSATYSKASPSDFIRIARSASNNMELQVNFSATNFRYAVHYTVQSDTTYVANTTVKAGMSSPAALIAPTYDYCGGKVLGTGGSSSVPVYVDAQGVVQECDIRPDADVALIVYGDATYSSVKALYNAGKKLYLVTGGNIQPSGRFEYRIPLTLITYDANLEVNAFYFEQPQDDRAGASEVGSIAVYRLDSTGWTTTPKQVGYAVNAGSAVTYTSGGGIDTALQGKMSTSGNNATNAAGGNIIRSMNAWTVPEDSEMIAAASSTGQGKYTLLNMWDNYFKNKVNSIVPNVGYMGASAMTAMQKNGTDTMPGNNCKICLDPNTFNSFGYNGFTCLGHYRPTGSGQKYYGWCGNFAQNGGIVEIDFDYTATVEVARSSITSLPTSLNVSFAAMTEYNAFRYGFPLDASTIFATAQETMRFEVNWPNASTIQGHARLIGRGAVASIQTGTRIYVGAAQTSSNNHFLVLNVNNIRIKVTSGQIYDVTYS